MALPEWMTFAGLFAGGGLLTGLAQIVAAKVARAGKKDDTNVALAQMAMTDKEKFYQTVMTQLDKVQTQAEELRKEVAVQAVQIAKLTAQVDNLQHAEKYLQEENRTLEEENLKLKQRAAALDEECQTQALLIRELTTRLQMVDPHFRMPSMTLPGGDD